MAGFWHAPENQPLVGIASPAYMVPVAILIDRQEQTIKGPDGTSPDLVQSFENFAAGLDLGRFEALAARPS